jgi:hypothetical protein
MPLVRSRWCIKMCDILTPKCTEINGFYTPLPAFNTISATVQPLLNHGFHHPATIGPAAIGHNQHSQPPIIEYGSNSS